MAPRVSVVLGVYNGARHVDAAIRSVLEQSFSDFELVVVDDGSTDATPEIVAAHARRDSRIAVVRQAQNGGLTAALVRGTRAASGAYIARQDADDLSLPSRFARQVAFLDRRPDVAAVGTRAEVIDADSRIIGALAAAHGPDDVRRGLLSARVTPVHGSMMMRRDVFEAVGGYREAFRTCQDYDLWLRLAAGHAIDTLPETLYRWRLGGDSVYTTQRMKQLKYAGIARAFAHERTRHGNDSYEALAQSAGDLDAFAAHYRYAGAVYAAWGDLLLRGTGNTPSVRAYLRRAIGRGWLRPWTLALCGWTHLGLPWPGSRPLSAS